MKCHLRSMLWGVAIFTFASACHDSASRPVPQTPSSQTEGTTEPAPTPATSTTTAETEGPATSEESHRDLVLLSPGAGDRVAGNPVTITGRARTFENNVVIELRDERGDLITTAWTTATGEMGSLNPFSTQVWITRDPGRRMTIDLIEHSARDGSLRARTRRTVEFAGETVEETLMFPLQNPGNDCARVVPVTRRIPAADGRLRAILEALIAGPTSREASELGVMGPFPQGSAVRGVNLQGARAIADFNERLSNVGGSCRAIAIRSSVEKTLTNVDGVDSVEIRAEGSADTALQP